MCADSLHFVVPSLLSKLRTTIAAIDMAFDLGYEYIRVTLAFKVGDPLPNPGAWIPLGEKQVGKFCRGEHAVLHISHCGCYVPYQLFNVGEMDGNKLYLYRRVKTGAQDALLVRGVPKVPYVTWVDQVLLFQCIGSESLCLFVVGRN